MKHLLSVLFAAVSALGLGLAPAQAWPAHGVVSGGSGSFTTFDPGNIGVTQRLAPGNLTVTNDQSGNTGIARSAASAMGKIHVEFHIDSIAAPGTVAIGVCDASQGLNTFVGASNDSWGLGFDGHQLYGGSSGPNLGTGVTAGDTVAMEFDAANGTIQFQRAGAGSWTTGPTYGTIPSGALYACISVADISASITANFGASPFAITQSPGYGTF